MASYSVCIGSHGFAGVLIFWTISFIFISYTMSKKLEKYSYAFSELENSLGEKIVDSISNIGSAKLFSNLNYEKEVILDSAVSLAAKDRQLQWNMFFTFMMQGMMRTLLLAFMLGGLIYARLQDWVTVGENLIRFSKEIGKCRQALNVIVAPHAR